MGRGRPKGSKNKPKAPEAPQKPQEPLISNEEQFDQLNKSDVAASSGKSTRSKIVAERKIVAESSPKKRVLHALQSAKWSSNKVSSCCLL